jgi:hypothetical protein
MDVNGNTEFDPAIDPAGLYGGTPPTAVNLTDGSDAIFRNLFLSDPPAPPIASSRSVHWKTSPRVSWLRNFAEAVQKAQLSRK